jgi:hypothetical protein
MKTNAATRLKASTRPHRVLASEDLVKEDGYNISTGANSFKFHDPAQAYAKAAEFVKKLISDGYKYDPRGAMSHKMDVFKKGGTEISVSVHNMMLNIDLW